MSSLHCYFLNSLCNWKCHKLCPVFHWFAGCWHN